MKEGKNKGREINFTYKIMKEIQEKNGLTEKRLFGGKEKEKMN